MLAACFDGLIAQTRRSRRPRSTISTTVVPQGEQLEVGVDREQEFASWIASVERGDRGYTYVRLYLGAPDWVKHMAVNTFGKGTVFIRPRSGRPEVA
jgi:hypothetical protein